MLIVIWASWTFAGAFAPKSTVILIDSVPTTNATRVAPLDTHIAFGPLVKLLKLSGGHPAVSSAETRGEVGCCCREAAGRAARLCCDRRSRRKVRPREGAAVKGGCLQERTLSDRKPRLEGAHNGTNSLNPREEWKKSMGMRKRFYSIWYIGKTLQCVRG